MRRSTALTDSCARRETLQFLEVGKVWSERVVTKGDVGWSGYERYTDEGGIVEVVRQRRGRMFVLAFAPVIVSVSLWR